MAGTNYKFSTLIEILDGNSGNPNEQWQLEGCFVQNADYSQSDYLVSDPVTIVLTLQYDNGVFTDTEIMPDTTFVNNSSILWLIWKLLWTNTKQVDRISRVILSFKTIRTLKTDLGWRMWIHYTSPLKRVICFILSFMTQKALTKNFRSINSQKDVMAFQLPQLLFQ